MTVDLATLAIQIDATQARVAALELDKLSVSGKKAEDQAKSTKTAFSKLNDDLLASTKVMASLAAAAAAAGFMTAMKGAIDAMAAMKDLGIQAGVTAEQISRFEAPARLAGVSMGEVSKAMFMMSKAMLEAQNPTSNAAQALKAIGISIDQIKSMRPDQQFELIARQLDKFADGSQKNAIMMELLSRAGYTTSKMMKEVASQGELTATVSNEMAEAADKVQDTWEEVRIEFDKGARAMVSEWLPSLTRWTEAVREAAREEGLWMAVKVAAGGLWAEALGLNDTEAEKTRARVKELNSEIRSLEEVVKEGPGFMEMLFGSQQGALEKRLADLKAELNLINTLAKAESGGYADQNDRRAQQGRVLSGAAPDFDPERQKAANEVLKERTRLMEVYQSIVGKAVGVDGDWLKKIADLNKALSDKVITQEQFNRALTAYVQQQPMIQNALKAEEEAHKAMVAQLEAEEEARIELKAVVAGFVADTAAVVADYQFEIDLIGKTASEVERLTAVRKIDMEMRRALAQLPVLGDDATAEQVEQQVRAIQSITMAGEQAKAALPALIEQKRVLTETMGVWDQASTMASQFFRTDLVFNGKDAIENLKQSFKSLLAEMVMIFAKRWVLNMAAQATGSSQLAGMAGQIGQGSLANSILGQPGGGSGILSTVGGWAASGLNTLGFTGASQFIGGATGAIAGPALPGSALAAGQGVGSMIGAAMPYIAAAVLAYQLFAKPRGGPKDEGEGYSEFTATGEIRRGARASTDFVTSTGRDADFASFTQSIGQSFFDTLFRLGGTAGGTMGFNFAGITDPRGTAQNMLRGGVTVNGQTVYELNRNEGRPEDLQAQMQTETLRFIVAGLKASELPAEVAAVFSSIDVGSATSGELEAALAKAVEIADVLAGMEEIALPFDLATLREFATSGESLTETFQRVGGAWATFNDLFTSDEERLASAQQSINSTFAQFGIAVPASRDAFEALVRGIDTSTESGRAMWEALVNIAPQFSAVADAADDAAEALASNMQSLYDVREQLGISPAGSAAQYSLGNTTAQFMASASWTQGLTAAEVQAALKTISDEDFSRYTAEQQQWILDILGGLANVEGAVNNVDQSVQAGYAISDGIVEGFAAKLRDVFTQANAAQGMGRTTMEGLSLRNTALGGSRENLVREMAAWEAIYGRGNLQYQEMSYNLRQIDNAIRDTGVGIARMTVLTAQYGEQKADELFELEQWYKGMQAALAGNQPALDALEEIFGERWQEILDGIEESGGGAADALARAREELLKYRDSLLLSDLSVLTPEQRLTQAQSEYEKLKAAAMAEGATPEDITAYQRASEALLREARSFYGSMPEYTEIFNRVLADLGLIGGEPQAISDPYMEELLTPTKATAENTAAMNDELVALRIEVAELTAKVIESAQITSAAVMEAAELQARTYQNVAEAQG